MQVVSMSDCIEWTGARSSAGYGQRQINGILYYLHRLEYEKHRGLIPKGLVVRHSCDNPACYNIEHLSIGTQKDNMQDCSKRGRINKTINARGEAQGLAKLTNELVTLILNSPLSGRKLAVELGVNRTTIDRVRSGKTWRHLNGDNA